MRRREIAFEELKTGVFVCRDGRGGPEFGRADTFEGALAVAAEWLRSQGFTGEAIVIVKPWRSTPFSIPAPYHNHH